MIHIYYGQDKNNIAFEKQSILKSNPNIKTIIFSDNYDELTNSISQPSLFEETNDILIDNATFLVNKTNSDKEVIKILLNSQNNIFCFAYDEKIDTKIPSLTYHKLTKFNNLSKQKLLSNLIAINKIDFESQSTRSYFESIIANEPFVIKNEYGKLILSRQSNVITRNQIDNISITSNNPNIFKLLKFLLQNNKNDLIKLYDDLILNKFQPIDLISTINTQLFNLKMFTLAKLNKWDDSDITNKLLLNQFTILSFRELRTNINKINELISEIWQLEYNMKHNNINQYLGFKFFLSK